MPPSFVCVHLFVENQIWIAETNLDLIFPFGLSSLFYRHPLPYTIIPSFLSFFRTSAFDKILYGKLFLNFHKNEKQHYRLFYKQHQVEIWSEILISSIKRSQKQNKQMKNLLSNLLLQNSCIINEKQCLSPFYRQPPIWTTPRFYNKIFYGFSKISNSP